MANLKDFFDYKNQIAEDLLTNLEIVRLIDETKDLSTAKDLMYTRIFPFEYLPDTVEHGNTYIFVDVDVTKSYGNSTFLLPTIFIWVLSHKSKLILPDHGGVRTDAICSEICETINGSRKYGLGELNFASTKRFAPSMDFNGKLMLFDAKDFNRLHDGSKPIPSNRKVG